MSDAATAVVTFTPAELERSISGLADVLQWINGFRAGMPSDSDIRLPSDWPALREINLKLKAARRAAAGGEA